MKTEAERQLAALVSMPTLSDDIAANDRALDYLEVYLKRRGMHTKRYRLQKRGALLASSRKDNLLTPKVLLGAHIDVVAGGGELFTLREENDKLIGRGTYDMKFAAAGYLQLVDDLQDRLDDYDFGIMITTDEEIGSQCAHGLVARGLRPGVCILPDSTAPNYDIETTAKGFWRFDLIAKGKTAHGARPWEGESASFKLIHALHELKDYFKDHSPATHSLNIGKLHGGHTYNVVPDEIISAVEIRYLNQDNLRDLQKMVQALCAKHRLDYREEGTLSAVTTDLSHPMVVPYLESVQEVTGRRPQPFTSCAASDAPPFFDAGVTCIISCCEGGGHHADMEWISRTSFLQFVPILTNYLDKVALTAHVKRQADLIAA